MTDVDQELQISIKWNSRLVAKSFTALWKRRHAKAGGHPRPGPSPGHAACPRLCGALRTLRRRHSLHGFKMHIQINKNVFNHKRPFCAAVTESRWRNSYGITETGVRTHNPQSVQMLAPELATLAAPGGWPLLSFHKSRLCGVWRGMFWRAEGSAGAVPASPTLVQLPPRPPDSTRTTKCVVPSHSYSAISSWFSIKSISQKLSYRKADWAPRGRNRASPPVPGPTLSSAMARAEGTVEMTMKSFEIIRLLSSRTRLCPVSPDLLEPGSAPATGPPLSEQGNEA